MSFQDLLDRFTRAVMDADIASFEALFTEDGIYDDVFYGRFVGRAAIGQMLKEHFHGNACRFLWDMHDPVLSANVGYAHYTFSYTSSMPHSDGVRAVFTGSAMFELREGLIAHYREWAYGLAGLSQLGTPEHIIARQADREATRILSEEAGRRHKTF
ncbi:MAG: nuclear transport factor 2 family protein [Gammaproteobacteria bacterium]|nr:nuclear transport factor 2 family protein [Gammaproteobacteria bacterium]